MKILLIDDSSIFRLGLKMAMQGNPAFELILEAGSPAEVRDILASTPDIDVAVVDISLEDEIDGLELLRNLSDGFPKIKTLVLSHYKRPDYIYKAISYRAQAYLSKDSGPEAVVKAILDVSGGNGLFFGDTIPAGLLLSLFGGVENIASGKPYSLTGKETEVLEAVASGYRNAEIATMMGISANTVESYKERIKGKLGCDNIVQCVAFAVGKGIISA